MAQESRWGLLWKKYLSDELTPDEWTELTDMLKTSDEGKKFFVDNSEEAKLLMHLGYMHSVNDESIRRKIEQGRRASSAPHRTWTYLAAACMAGMIFMAGWLFYGPKPKSSAPVAAKATAPVEIAPGGRGAILTLGNGNRIDLDIAKQGLVAEEGKSKVSKVAGGQLAYAPATTEALVNFNTVTTDRGTYQVTLPDGTKVWLDAMSSAKFPTAFTGREREIEVTGQVFIEAARDKHQPFRVKIPDGTYVNVLGTRFNINAYSKNAKVTLVDGAVQVGREKEEVILHPGQEAQVGSKINVLSNADIDQVTAWKEGFFQWQSADIETVMDDLQRWYPIDVKYEGGKSARHLTAHVSRSNYLSDVLQILESSGYRFRVEGQTVT
ncbi:MAG: FecR domain-containing protein, partial [Bacteroidota bacterium]|nr:FecR domain-containing protein [Bacteroidota bacterium]